MGKIKFTEQDITFALFSQLPNGNKYKATQMWTSGGTTADVLTMYANGRTSEYEVKTSVSDFRADKKKVAKHRLLATGKANWALPNRFYYAMPKAIYDKVVDEIPEYAGVVVIGGYKNWNGYRTHSISVVKRAPLIHKLVDKEKWMERFANSMSNRWFYHSLKYNNKFFKDNPNMSQSTAKIPNRPIDKSVYNLTDESDSLQLTLDLT